VETGGWCEEVGQQPRTGRTGYRKACGAGRSDRVHSVTRVGLAILGESLDLANLASIGFFPMLGCVNGYFGYNWVGQQARTG
jgi:hypothetical protein